MVGRQLFKAVEHALAVLGRAAEGGAGNHPVAENERRLDVENQAAIGMGKLFQQGFELPRVLGSAFKPGKGLVRQGAGDQGAAQSGAPADKN